MVNRPMREAVPHRPIPTLNLTFINIYHHTKYVRHKTHIIIIIITAYTLDFTSNFKKECDLYE